MRADAEKELDRPGFALLWSSIAAGLTIGFSFLAGAYLYTLVPARLPVPATALGYPLGFVFVSTLATLEPLTVQAAVAFAIIIVTIGGNAPLQFAVAAVGSGLLSELLKRTFARPRPAGPHVIRWIRGFSYPSGDLLTAPAIYLTIALIVSPHLPDGAARAVLYMIITTLLSLLAACRVYVGVHYPSDVTGGVLLGAAWALFTSAWFV